MLIAFAVLLLVLVPVSYLLDNVLGQAGTARNKVQALSIAEKWIEKLNATGPPNAATGLPEVGVPIHEGTKTDGGTRYTTSATIRYYPIATFTWEARTVTGKSLPDLCTSKTVPKIMRLTVTVSFPRGKVSDTTEIDYPPSGLPTDGFLGVQVEGSPTSATDSTPPPTKNGVSWGSRVKTVPVVVTTATTTGKVHRAYAGADGCAFFELPVGTYTVDVGPDTQVTPFVTTGSTTGTSINPPTKFQVLLSKVTEAGPYLYDEGAYINIAYPNSTVTDTSVACPDVAQFQCLVAGQGTVGGATAAVNVLSGSSWTSLDLPAAAGIEKVESSACTSTACVGVGFGASGAAAVVDDPNHIGSWKASPPPSTLDVSIIRHVQCPAANDCLALGTTPSGPVILGAVISTAATGAISLSWAADSIPSTMALTSTSQLACAGSSACFVAATTSTGPVVLVAGASGAAQAWKQETLTPSMSSIADLTCAGTTACLLDGTTSAGGPAVLAGAVSATSETWQAETLPTLHPATTLSSLTCVGTTACLATGNAKTGPSVVAGAVSATPGTWTSQTLKSTSMKSASLLACGSAACAVVGTDGSGDGIFSGPAATGTATWVNDKITSGLLLTHIHCSGTTTCVVIGADTVTQVAVLLTGTLNATKTKTTTFSRATFPAVAAATTASDVTGGGTKKPVQLAESVRSQGPTAHTTASRRAASDRATGGGAPPARLADTFRSLDTRVHEPGSSGLRPATETAYPSPTITSLTPTTGPSTGGTTVVLHVSHFTWSYRVTVTFGGTSATTVRLTTFNTTITVKTPAHAGGAVAVTVTVPHFYGPQTATKSAAFTFGGSILSVTPVKGPTTGGTPVTIRTSNLTLAGTTVNVTFGGKPAGTVRVTSTNSRVTAVTPAHPAGAVTVKVTVTKSSGSKSATKRTGFTYVVPAPTVTKVTPATGITTGGTTVTITGTHLTGATAVRFGTSSATKFTLLNSTTISAVIPSHAAGTVSVSVSTAGGTATDSTSFTYVYPAPTITKITPITGATTGGTRVTITGTHLTGVSAVDFGATAGTSVTSKSSTQLTVLTPAHRPGAVPVSVTARGGTTTRATGFTFVTPSPAITGVTPNTGSTKGGTVVSIAGHFLTAASAVTFGGSAATTVKVVSATRITATTPAHAAGWVTVTVTTPSGTATKSTGFRYVTPPPTTPVFLTGVSCFKTTTLTCVTAGATEHGAVLLVGTRGSTGAFTWTSHAAVTGTAPIRGIVAPDLPVSVRNTQLATSFFVACTGSSAGLCTSAGPLFPYTSGYTVGAGNCLQELSTSTAVDTIPGTKATTSGPAAVVPLGLMAVEVVRPTGKPVAGARISATINDTAPCSSLTLTMGTTEADGVLALATITEKYTLTVTSGTTPPVKITLKAARSDEVVSTSNATSSLLPAPIRVTL